MSLRRYMLLQSEFDLLGQGARRLPIASGAEALIANGVGAGMDRTTTFWRKQRS